MLLKSRLATYLFSSLQPSLFSKNSTGETMKNILPANTRYPEKSKKIEKIGDAEIACYPEFHRFLAAKVDDLVRENWNCIRELRQADRPSNSCKSTLYSTGIIR